MNYDGRDTMSILGKIVNAAGQAACLVGGAALDVTGEVVAGVGSAVTKNKDYGKDLKKLSKDASKYMYQSTKKVGKGCEKVVDTAFAISGEIGSGIAGGVAELAKADYETVQKAKKVGRIAGGVGLGILVGDAVEGAIIGAAASGAASTGTAISTLSGAAETNAILASIGGGSLAAGGLGVAGGQAVLAGVNAATAIDGAVAGATAKDKLEREKKESQKRIPLK